MSQYFENKIAEASEKYMGVDGKQTGSTEVDLAAKKYAIDTKILYERLMMLGLFGGGLYLLTKIFK